MIDSGKLTDWYDLQAPFYRFWRGGPDQPLVRRVVALLGASGAARRVLDAGCGTGLFALGLAAADPGRTVEGLDASRGMLDVARREAARSGRANVTFRQGDVIALPYPDGSFDAAVAAGLFPNLNEPRRALGELARVLVPGGRLVVVEFDREALTFALRLFFEAMILGYKTVALVLPRFRFAARWNVRTSTIDRPVFERDVRAAGFEIRELARQDAHLLYQLEKGLAR